MHAFLTLFFFFLSFETSKIISSSEVSLQRSGLRVQCCCCTCGAGHSCYAGLIPGQKLPHAGTAKNIDSTNLSLLLFKAVGILNGCLISILFIYLFICYSGPRWQQMEVPRLDVKSEPQQQAYITAIAAGDLSRVRNLLRSSQQPWILNPLGRARDQTCILMDTSWVCHYC